MASQKSSHSIGLIAAVGLASAYVFIIQSSDAPSSRAGAPTGTTAYAQGPPTGTVSGASHDDATGVNLTDSQLASVQVELVRELEFPVEKRVIGTITFDAELTVDVFTPYPGRIIGTFARLGDDVKAGETLFTIDSPDLLQAESALIAAAGQLEFTTRNLTRQRELVKFKGASQKDFEQATADQQAAEGALKTARNALRLFGKTEAEIDRIINERMADSVLVVPSRINGRITARNAAPGLYVLPGNAPAPYTVTDIESMWMLANVAETDIPAFRVGQEVEVSVSAFPGRVFYGRITEIGEIVDPNTRRVLVRSDVANEGHELKSGMFANFVVSVGKPIRSPAVPLAGVVREGDGTTTVWVTADRHRFTRRTVKIGSQTSVRIIGSEQHGYRQILEGVQAGELIATEGALFLSQALATASH
jgi:membrane fusion protein, heavy metal efflux system